MRPAYENGCRVLAEDPSLLAEDALSADEVQAVERYGLNAALDAEAALRQQERCNDPRFYAALVTLQFVHDARNSRLAIEVVKWVSGQYLFAKEREIAKGLAVSFGAWCGERDIFKGFMADVIDDESDRAMVLKAVGAVISEISEAAQPKLAALQLATACGIDLVDGESSTVSARNFGTSKQGFHQGKKRFMRRFRIAKTRASRNPSENFTRQNFRHPTKKI